MERFIDRDGAGRMLAARLADMPLSHPVVLGLPRGGVPVAAPIAEALHAPLDVLVVRKLGVPWHEEVAMGAVGEGGATALNTEVTAAARVSAADLERVERRERAEVEQRVRRFRMGRAAVDLHGRAAIVVDDGIATGATARAACAIARARGAASVVVAVPVAAPEALDALTGSGEADEVLCLHAPDDFMAVGMHYLDFRQVDDDTVVELLRAQR